MDLPACQARSVKPTYCVTAPSRATTTCEDTRNEPTSAKYGCSSAGKELVNSRSIQGPPNSPGGRLMPCTTIRSASTPAGRASWFGDAICLTPRISPLLRSTCKSASLGYRYRRKHMRQFRGFDILPALEGGDSLSRRSMSRTEEDIASRVDIT